jgi:hypothetical protein
MPSNNVIWQQKTPNLIQFVDLLRLLYSFSDVHGFSQVPRIVFFRENLRGHTFIFRGQMLYVPWRLGYSVPPAAVPSAVPGLGLKSSMGLEQPFFGEVKSVEKISSGCVLGKLCFHPIQWFFEEI